MKFKYKKTQIFRKKLQVPKIIYEKIYSNTLTYLEYFKYNLYDKIPTDCLNYQDRKFVEDIGSDELKNIDWEMLEKYIAIYVPEDKRLDFITLNSTDFAKTINNQIYNAIKYDIDYFYFSKNMKKHFMITDQSDNEEIQRDIEHLNSGIIFKYDILEKWDFFKDKDLSLFINREFDEVEERKHVDSILKDRINEYKDIILLLDLNLNFNFNFNEYIKLSNEEFNDLINEKTEEYFKEKNLKNLNNDQIFILSKYLGFEKILEKFNFDEEIKKELINIDSKLLLESNIPLNMYSSYSLCSLIKVYGLKNILKFDQENEMFFSSNNFKNLENIYYEFIRYPQNYGEFIHNKNNPDDIYNHFSFLINGRGKYKIGYEDFPESLKVRYPQLYLSKDAPEELKEIFYKMDEKYKIFLKNPEYIQYIKNIDLTIIFEEITVRDQEYEYHSLIKSILSEMGKEEGIDFLFKNYEMIKNVTNHELITINSEISMKENIFNIFQLRIENNKILYNENIDEELKSRLGNIFLPEDAPQELKELFYNTNEKYKILLENPEYEEYFKDIENSILFPSLEGWGNFYNLAEIIEQGTSKDYTREYLKKYYSLIAKGYKNYNKNYNFIENFNEETIYKKIGELIYNEIINSNINYYKDAPEHLKESYPEIYLSEDTQEGIKEKFYSRSLQISDFEENSELIKNFTNKNILFGFSVENAMWLKSFYKEENIEASNLEVLKILSEYEKINDNELKKHFRNYVLRHKEDLNFETLKSVRSILERLENTNSNELFAVKKSIADQILELENPEEAFNKIEDIFVKSKIPTFTKLYSCFEILNPEVDRILKSHNYTVSPVLLEYKDKMSPVLSNSTKIQSKVTIFTDLFKSALGSNNRSLKEFLSNLENGNNLYNKIKDKQLPFDKLSQEEKEVLEAYSKNIIVTYNNSLKIRENKTEYISNGDIIEDISRMYELLSPNKKLEYNLPDRIVKMYGGFMGIKTIEDAKNYMERSIKSRDEKSRILGTKDMVLEEGDYIKGIGNDYIRFLNNILQNGSVSKEFLGESAISDATPLDTDLSRIMSNDKSNKEKLEEVAAIGYGPVYFVLKNDDRFNITRNDDGTKNNIKRDFSKLEIFKTGVLGNDHYGIRTGFASSEIDYIVCRDEYDERIAVEIVKNGFYIPIASLDGKILFTPKDYDMLKEKMQGLTYYNEQNFEFSENLETPQIDELTTQIDQGIAETQRKRNLINTVVQKAISDLDLELKIGNHQDLTNGVVELVDTGSTGRNTNLPGDGDFDFIMKLDKSIVNDPEQLQKLKEKIESELKINGSNLKTGNGDFRFTKVEVQEGTEVDLDITFTRKDSRLEYTSEMAVEERLENIKSQDRLKYKLVLANIIKAKQLLKSKGVYKSKNAATPQGGLGGIGVENWILQNGGSLLDACNSFLEASKDKTFEEFKSGYSVWDFGSNYLSITKNFYPHDNFVENNMSEDGYELMKEFVQEYILEYNKYLEEKAKEKSTIELARESYDEQKEVEYLDIISSQLEKGELEIEKDVELEI